MSRKPIADLDRLIFLRICEDRGIEHYAFLQSLMNGERVYPRLVKHFRDATDGSQLTAHGPRPSNSGPSAVSRKPMADPNGQVYEQFLGKVIRLTAGHQAKVEEKPEVRKAAVSAKSEGSQAFASATSRFRRSIQHMTEPLGPRPPL